MEKLVSDEQEKFEDTNGVIRHHKSEDIQYNDRTKKNKHRVKPKTVKLICVASPLCTQH